MSDKSSGDEEYGQLDSNFAIQPRHWYFTKMDAYMIPPKCMPLL